MPTLAEIRLQYPQYRDVPDQALADGLYQKFYSDVPREEFDRRLGIRAAAAPAAPQEPVSGEGETGLVSGLTRGFTGAVKQLGPTMGAGIEAAGISTGVPGIERAGTRVREITESETPVPDLVRLRDFFQKPFTFIGEQIGSGVGSTLPSLVGGAAGAGAGALTGPAAPIAVPAGIIAGAGAPALLQNTGDLYQQLQEEGIDRERAARVASIWGPVLTVPDVFAASRLLKPFLGSAVTDLSTKGIARAIATRMKQGATVEGITELGQNVGQEAIVALETGRPDLLNRAERVATGAIAGGLTGGVTGAGGALVERARGAAPPPDTGAPPDATEPTPPPEGTPPVGAVLGLAEGDGAPFRAQVDAYSDDGRFVFLRDEDGERITIPAADLPGIMQTAPPPSGRPGDPTAVPTPPPDETPPVSEDEARFYDQFEEDSIPPAPPRPGPPAPSLDLGDPARADAMLAGAQRQKVAVETAVQKGALTPEDGARRLRVLDDVIADAERMRARVAAAPPRPDAASVAAAAQVRDAEAVGDLGAASQRRLLIQPTASSEQKIQFGKRRESANVVPEVEAQIKEIVGTGAQTSGILQAVNDRRYAAARGNLYFANDGGFAYIDADNTIRFNEFGERIDGDVDAASMAAARDLEARQRAGALGQQAGAPRPVEAPDQASIEAARRVGAREEMARMQAPPRAAKPAPVSAKKPKPPQTFLEWLSEVGIREGDPEIADLGETDLLRNWHKDKRFRKKIIRPDGMTVQQIVKEGERQGFIGTNLGGRSMGTAETAGEAQQQYATASKDDVASAIYEEGVRGRPVVRARDREAQADLLSQQAAVADAGEFAARYGNGAEGQMRRNAEMLGIETWDTADVADLQEQIAERLAIMDVATVEQALAAMATVDAPVLSQEGYTNDFDLTDDIAQEGPAPAERSVSRAEEESEIPGFESGPELDAAAERAPAPVAEDRRVDRGQRRRYDEIAAEVRRKNPGMPEQAVREEVLDRMAEPATEATDQGDNFILGADTVGTAEQADAATRARAEAEMKARQQQSKIRRGDQKSVADQEGGLFDAGRDQGDLLGPKRQPMRRPKKRGREAVEAENARILAASANKLGINLDESGVTPQMARAAAAKTASTPVETDPMRPMYRLGEAWKYVVQATAVAGRDRAFARLYNAVMGQHYTETALIKDGGEKLDGMLRLNEKQAATFNKIAEYLTVSGKRPKRVGKTLVIRTEPVSITEDVKQEDGSSRQVRRTVPTELSKPGDIIEADEATTKAIFDALKYGDERWMTLNGARARQFGYTGEFTRAAIEKAIKDSPRPRERATAEMALALYEAAEDGKRKAYFPLMRYGDAAIVIKPKPGSAANKSGGFPSTKEGWVEFVESEGPLSGLLSGTATGRGRVQKRLEELKKRFPPDQYDYERKYLQTAKDVTALDIEGIDRVMAAANLKDAQQAAAAYKDALNLKTPEYEKALKELAREIPAAARRRILDQLKAGMLRERETVPGYATDFRRALMDYNRSTAGVISRRLYRQPLGEAEISVFGNKEEGVTAQSHPSVQRFARRYLDYIDAPEHAAFRTGRWLGFYLSIFGSFGSAAVNGISTATITAPQIAAWSPRGAAGVVPAFRRALRGMTWDNTRGFTIDYSKIPGQTADEAEAIRQGALKGFLAPQLSLEFQGTDVGSLPEVQRRLGGVMRRYSDVGSSLFNVVEQLNRYTAFIAAYRAAQSPAARQRFKKMYAKNERVQDMLRTEGDTPATIAQFMVEQTQFIGGQYDRPSVLRGAGGVILQFKTFPINYTRILVENLTRQGPQGKFAAGLMMLGLFSFAGLLGLPFAQDALDITEIAYKALAGGEDEDLEGALRGFIADIYDGGERREGETEEAYQKRRDRAVLAAEVWMRGPTREFMGFEGGTRFGVGEVGPEIGDIVQAVPLLAGTIGRGQEAYRRFASGQDVGGAVAAVSPLIGKGPADAARGLVQYPAEGYQTQRGRQVVDPEDITYGQMALKAIGFQPAEMARRTERDFAARREASSDAEVRANRVAELGNLYSQALKAQEAGNGKRAERLFNRVAVRLEDIADQHAKGEGPPPPELATIRRRALENLDPDLRTRRAPRDRRQEALDVPYVNR